MYRLLAIGACGRSSIAGRISCALVAFCFACIAGMLCPMSVSAEEPAVAAGAEIKPVIGESPKYDANLTAGGDEYYLPSQEDIRAFEVKSDLNTTVHCIYNGEDAAMEIESGIFSEGFHQYVISGVVWYEDGAPMSTGDTFKKGHAYKCEAIIYPNGIIKKIKKAFETIVIEAGWKYEGDLARYFSCCLEGANNVNGMVRNSVRTIVLYETDRLENIVCCTVNFDANGHGTAPDSILDVPEGSTIECPENPEADGYDFCGWYTEAECETAWDFGNDVVTKDITLYAKWKKKNVPDKDKEPDKEPEEENEPESEPEPVIESAPEPVKESVEAVVSAPPVPESVSPEVTVSPSLQEPVPRRLRVPQTGDDSRLVLWSALMLASCAGIFVFFGIRRRRNGE